MLHEQSALTATQIEHFMHYGYVRLEECFTREQAADWTSNVWVRLGFDQNDKSTWTSARINMPAHRHTRPSEFAPKAWAGICELLGGEDRVARESDSWGDSLIVNLGTEEFEGKVVDPKDLPGWHVDGDMFRHFLDSPEQGLLVIPLFTDIKADAGGTFVCPDGLGKIARYLHEHTEGVDHRMNPANQPLKYDGVQFYNEMVQTCTEFHEMTGNIGDVILLHPLMVHSASRNSLRIPRIITNPPVALRKPFNFDRNRGSDYSIVEKKTLRELGVESLGCWSITGRRQAVIPDRVKEQAKMMEDEKSRLQGLQSQRVPEVTVQ